MHDDGERFDCADRIAVRYLPYQLDPGAPARAEPMLDHLARRFGAQARAMADRVIRIGEEEGLVMNYDRVKPFLHGFDVMTGAAAGPAEA